MLQHFLGLPFQARIGPAWRITAAESPDGPALEMPDSFFSVSEGDWLQPVSLPRRPLAMWEVGEQPMVSRLVSPRLPVIFGDNPAQGAMVRRSDARLYLGLDVLGAAFFMLTRYEEVVNRSELDSHGRFPASASLAFQEGFLDRPIINEYLEVLKAALIELWPGLCFRERQYIVRPTHDVDDPLREGFASLPRAVAGAARDLLKHRSIASPRRRLSRWVATRGGDMSADTHNTFDHLMNLSEKHGLRSAFYFVAESASGPYACPYSLDHPWIRRLLGRIHERGHEVGFHASYSAFGDSVRTASEFADLRRVAAEEGVEQQSWGGRQHYLRWSAPDTWQDWDDAGLRYDSTLSYTDFAGFRCGVCYEYPAFNVLTRERLSLCERPLIAMESGIFEPRYMGLSPDEGATRLALLASRCRLYGGEFVFLWHNSYLVETWQSEGYTRALAECA